MNPESVITLSRGFLPAEDPLLALPASFEQWEIMGKELPKILLSNDLHQLFDEMPVYSIESLETVDQLELAMLRLSFFGHAYVWGTRDTPHRIPPSIAVPWYEVSKKLHRHPVLSYASYALHNWRRIDKNLPIQLGNIALLQNFLGGLDEEWFVLVHIEIEMEAAQALQHFLPLQAATLTDEIDNVQHYLNMMTNSLEKMCTTLDRMPEKCDPYIYYNRVRPYIHGWKDNPVLPKGLIYEGVGAYQDSPQFFRGETGAQSSIVPAFDALLGVEHHPDPLRVYLMEMREYMPWSHRVFLNKIEQQGSIRHFILNRHKTCPMLRESYNACLNLLSRFRQTHLKYAAQYIQKQHQSSPANPTSVGTGGTPFMDYLRKHKDETLQFLIE